MKTADLKTEAVAESLRANLSAALGFRGIEIDEAGDVTVKLAAVVGREIAVKFSAACANCPQCGAPPGEHGLKIEVEKS